MVVVRKPEPAAILEVLFIVGNGGALLEMPAFPVPVTVAAMFKKGETMLCRDAESVDPDSGRGWGIRSTFGYCPFAVGPERRHIDERVKMK